MASRKQTEFHEVARKKGWRLVDIGERWGVSERQMSRIANRPTQKDLDAAHGLPKNDFGGQHAKPDIKFKEVRKISNLCPGKKQGGSISAVGRR
jgi:hypothetical protein